MTDFTHAYPTQLWLIWGGGWGGGGELFTLKHQKQKMAPQLHMNKEESSAHLLWPWSEHFQVMSSFLLLQFNVSMQNSMTIPFPQDKTLILLVNFWLLPVSPGIRPSQYWLNFTIFQDSLGGVVVGRCLSYSSHQGVEKAWNKFV